LKNYYKRRSGYYSPFE